MEARHCAVGDLFTRSSQFSIPPFQRSYCWRMDEHWEPLWEDIENYLLLSDEAVSTPGSEPPTHFLGAVIIQAVDSSKKKRTVEFSIVDGQQRITTLQVFMLAVIYFAKQHEMLSDTLAIYEEMALNLGAKGEEEWKLVPALADRQAYLEITKTVKGVLNGEGKSQPPPPKSKKSGIDGAFVFFLRKIEEFGARGENQLTVLNDRLLNLARKFMEIVRIDLKAVDNAQEIFESLNSQGEPLAASDLIKNSLLRFVPDPDEQQRLYNDHWRHLDIIETNPKDFSWANKVRVGTNSIPQIDHFFVSYLVYKLRKDFHQARLHFSFLEYFNPQKKEYETEQEAVEKQLREIQTYSECYRSLYEDHTASEVKQFIRLTEAISNTTSIPLVFWLQGAYSKMVEASPSTCPEDVKTILAYFGSWLIRRSICQENALGHNKISIPLINRLENTKQKEGNLLKAVYSFLNGSDGDQKAKWPDDESLQEKFFSLITSNPQNTKRAVFLLQEIDRSLKTPQETPDFIRQSSKLFPLLNNSELASVEKHARLNGKPFDEKSIGLFTLIETEGIGKTAITDASKLAFHKKIDWLTANSRLAINVQLTSSYANEKSFGIEDMNKRIKFFADRAITIWPSAETQ